MGGLIPAMAVEAGLSYEDVTCTVIGSPGVVDERSGAMRLAANLSGWNGPGVLDALRERLGPSLAIENDINLAALGEQAHGLGRGSPTSSSSRSEPASAWASSSTDSSIAARAARRVR